MRLGEVYIEPELARLALLANSVQLPRRQANPLPKRISRRQANRRPAPFAPTFLTPLPSDSTRVHFDDPSIEEELSE